VNHLFVSRDTVYENHNIVMGLYRIIHLNHIKTINNIPKWPKTNTQKWSIAIPKANHSLSEVVLVVTHDQMESVNSIVSVLAMWK
jgi:hypothetical protein